MDFVVYLLTFAVDLMSGIISPRLGLPSSLMTTTTFTTILSASGPYHPQRYDMRLGGQYQIPGMRYLVLAFVMEK